MSLTQLKRLIKHILFLYFFKESNIDLIAYSICLKIIGDQN